jgi:serine phosphatase RsbU (regulator of sigma subunit)
MRAARYRAEECRVTPPARLYVFSDGVYEISRPDGAMLEAAAFTDVLTRPDVADVSRLESLLRFARDVRGSEVLEDDFSIIQMTIGGVTS